MSETWQSAWVEVLPDFKSFTKDANHQMSGILSSAGNQAGIGGSKAFGSSFVGGIGKLAAPIGAAILALGIGRMVGEAIGNGINFALDGIDLASDLSESTNAIKVAYGDASVGIANLGADAATRLGLTENAFNGIATQFSGFAGTVAGAGGDVVGFIDKLTTRGSDFASVYNIDVADALGLFQSGLAGETEPLRKYGVDLSAAAVSAYALANGIGTSGKELTEAEKVQSRYGLLLAKTDMVQGDFANTSDGLANQQKILAASFETAKTKLGESLLPVMTELTKFANEELIPVLGDVIDEVGPVLADALIEAVPAFKELMLAVAPLIPDLVRLAVEALPPMLDFFILVTPWISDMVRNLTDFLSVTSNMFGVLTGDVSLSQFTGNLGTLGSAFGDVTKGVFDFGFSVAALALTVGTKIGEVIGFFHRLPGQIVGAVGGLGATLYSAGRDLIQGLINGASSLLKNIGTFFLNVVPEFIREPFKKALGINSPSKVFAGYGANLGEGLIQGVVRVQSKVDSAVRSMVSIPTLSSVGVSLSGAQSSANSGVREPPTFIIHEAVSPVATAMEVARRQNMIGAV